MSGACCKIDYDQLLVYVESILNKKILCGELQPGLKSCSDEGAACTTILPQGTGVVTCAELADLVERLIEEGDIAIPGIKDFKLDGFVLELTDQADKVWRVDLEALFDTLIKSIRLQDGKLIFTKRDDTTWEVDLQPIIDEAKLVSATIDANGNLVLESGDGSKITVDLGQSAGRITQLLLDGDYVLHAIRGDGSEIIVDLKRLKSVVVDPGSPILGDGTEEDPLTFDPSRLCLHLIENVEWTEAGLVFTFTDECDPLIVPIGTITTALKCKVAICVADGSGLTGDGTAENPLDFDPATLSNEKVTELIERLIDQLVEVLPDRLACKIQVCHNGNLAGSGTTEDPLRVNIDPRTDNLLQENAAGQLLVVLEAPADLSRQYVSESLGSDTNPGTYGAPLKTLDHALSRIPNTPGTFIIFVRYGESFIVGDDNGTYPRPGSYGGSSITSVVIQPYDEPKYQTPEVSANTSRCPGYKPIAADDFVRPTVTFRATAQTQLDLDNNIISYRTIVAKGVNLHALNVVTEAHDSSKTIRPQGITSAAALNFNSCRLYLHGTLALLPQTVLELNTCRVEEADTPYLAVVYRKFTITDINDPGNGGACGVPELPTYVPLVDNVRDIYNYTNLVNAPQQDVALKKTFNYDANWDIFA